MIVKVRYLSSVASPSLRSDFAFRSLSRLDVVNTPAVTLGGARDAGLDAGLDDRETQGSMTARCATCSSSSA
eukprot:1602801-Prymnesium_polylepis.1